nr:BON domain-containing protein [Actinomycetota bacterium]
RLVRDLRGVLMVTNDIEVTAPAASGRAGHPRRPGDDLAACVQAVITNVLREDPATFSVAVHDGVVWLTGSLSSPEREAAAARLAADVDGVVDVINKMDRQPLGA